MPKLTIKSGAIRRLREMKSWSQEDLAEKSGVSARTVQRAESGNSLQPNNLACIAGALDVEPSELLEATDGEHPGAQASAKEKEQASVPIAVVLNRVCTGSDLLRCVDGSLALHADARSVIDPNDADAIGRILDELRDYLDIGSELSFSDQLRYGIDLTSQMRGVQDRGWWFFAGKKRHKLCSSDFFRPIPWVSCIVIVARADDSIVEHREDSEPVTFFHIPKQVTFK